MKPTLRIVVLVLFATLIGVGCKTQFVGEPKVPGGAQGCGATCASLGMELAGMVVMGEYSDGCICAVPGRPATDKAAMLYVGASGTVAPAAGVRMQMDDEEENRRRNHRGF